MASVAILGNAVNSVSTLSNPSYIMSILFLIIFALSTILDNIPTVMTIGTFKAGRSSQTQLAAHIRISLYKVDFGLRQVHVSCLIQIINL